MCTDSNLQCLSTITRQSGSLSAPCRLALTFLERSHLTDVGLGPRRSDAVIEMSGVFGPAVFLIWKLNVQCGKDGKQRSHHRYV